MEIETPNSGEPGLPRPSQRITPRALLEVKRLSEPRLHPDGRRVAFVVTEADFEDSRWVSHIWMTEWLPEDDPLSAPSDPEGLPNAAGETAQAAEGEAADGAPEADASRQLTYSHEGEFRPEWSPDGRWLAFLSERPDPADPEDEDDEEEPKCQLWLLPIDGGEAYRLTNAKEGILEYAWAPDGKSLIYLAPEPRPRPVESVRKERLRHKHDPIVEHDDRLRRQFWSVDIDQGKHRLLFTADYGVGEFAISPDGDRLCYSTNYTGEWNDYHQVDLYIRRLEDGTTYKLVQRKGGKYCLRWSPSSYQLAFLSWLDPEISYSRSSIFIAGVPKDAPGGVDLAYGPDAPGITECRLLNDLDHDIKEFVWTPENNVLCAIAAVKTQDEIYGLDAGMTNRLDMGEPAMREHLHIDWGSSSIVYVQESAKALEEIYLRDGRDGVHQLTRLNAEFAETYRLPRQEVVRWSSTDGKEIEGVLTYPLDFREGAPAPMIVQVHGGPKDRAMNIVQAYGMPMVWSAEGYAVLQPNFRGSEGYGNAFAVSNRRDLGGGDFNDIMSGVDWCVAQNLADPARLGIMGGSYGGYMTNWAIGHTDRFKAAISMFGIFNLQTDFSNSELSRWDNDYLGAYYWEDQEIYRKLSPGSYVDDIRTPTLILHGDDDTNTFISNSKELYQALRHRGVAVQFVHYPREGHGLREPNHKLDEVRRSLAWMDAYLLGAGAAQTVYRMGDRVPSADGMLEMNVTRAAWETFVGQPAPNDGETKEPETGLLEIMFTVHNRDTRRPTEPRTVMFSEIRLAPIVADDVASMAGEAPAPVGAPLDLPGGKLLLEGSDLRVVQHPNQETGLLAFAVGAVFRLPRTTDRCRLSVRDFPAVEIALVPAAIDPQIEEENRPDAPK